MLPYATFLDVLFYVTFLVLHKWIINCVDVCARYAMSDPMKTKELKSIMPAFKHVQVTSLMCSYNAVNGTTSFFFCRSTVSPAQRNVSTLIPRFLFIFRLVTVTCILRHTNCKTKYEWQHAHLAFNMQTWASRRAVVRQRLAAQHRGPRRVGVQRVRNDY